MLATVKIIPFAVPRSKLDAALAMGEAMRVAAFRPEVPAALDQLVADCLEIDPARRPASATVVVDRLEAILGELDPSRVELAPVVTAGPRPASVRPAALALLFGVVVFAVVATWLAWVEPVSPTIVGKRASQWSPTRAASPMPGAPAQGVHVLGWGRARRIAVVVAAPATGPAEFEETHGWKA